MSRCPLSRFLLDLEYGEDLVDSILSRDKDGDSNGNDVDVVDDGGRNDTSTNDGGDIEDDALCQDTGRLTLPWLPIRSNVLVFHVDVFMSIIVIASWGRQIGTPLLGRRKPLASKLAS